MAEITNAKIDEHINHLRGAATTLRRVKATVNSLVVRSADADVAAPIGTKAEDVFVQARPDAKNIPSVSVKNYGDLIYALGVIKNALDTIPDALIEKFCVGPME